MTNTFSLHHLYAHHINPGKDGKKDGFGKQNGVKRSNAAEKDVTKRKNGGGKFL